MNPSALRVSAIPTTEYLTLNVLKHVLPLLKIAKQVRPPSHICGSGPTFGTHGLH